MRRFLHYQLLWDQWRLLSNPVGSNESYKLNYRGLENPCTIKTLRKGIQQEEPILVFFMETKLNKEKIEKVRDQCNFDHSWVVPSLGKSGGLALFWMDGVTVEVLSAEQSHIDTLVKGGVSKDWWHLMGFYGWSETLK